MADKVVDIADLAKMLESVVSAQAEISKRLAPVGKGKGKVARKTTGLTALQLWIGKLDDDGTCLRDCVEAVWEQSEKDFPGRSPKCFTSEYGRRGEALDSPQAIFREAYKAIREASGADKVTVSDMLEGAGYIQQGRSFSKEADPDTGKKRVYFYWTRPGMAPDVRPNRMGFSLQT